jgi:hypothetical protein
MAEYYCEAHMSPPKAGRGVGVRFLAMPGRYQCADPRIFTTMKAAEAGIERLEERWGHPIQLIQNSRRAPAVPMRVKE